MRPVFHAPIDYPGIAIYAFEFVLWIGIVLCGIFMGRGEKEQLEIELSPGAQGGVSGESTQIERVRSNGKQNFLSSGQF